MLKADYVWLFAIHIKLNKNSLIKIVVWEFYIGGYLPAQKWLKDRRGRILCLKNIMHYQKIIVALAETDSMMKDIDEIEISL